MTAFCDLPHDLRLQLRDVIEKAGGEIVGYLDNAVQVALPDASVKPSFNSDCEAAGLIMAKGSLHYFPLGSDAPPAILRHDGRYPGSKGFWLYARFHYLPPCPACGKPWVPTKIAPPMVPLNVRCACCCQDGRGNVDNSLVG